MDIIRRNKNFLGDLTNCNNDKLQQTAETHWQSLPSYVSVKYLVSSFGADGLNKYIIYKDFKNLFLLGKVSNKFLLLLNLSMRFKYCGA